MSVPFFTIVTPVYNGEKYISKTIESIINQTYKNYDYIIIDGLSKDKSLEKIISYKKYITKIISEEDNGMYDAISKGFSVSRGKYLLWLNSDDILIDKNALYRLHKILNKYSYDWVVGRVSFIKRNNKIIKLLPLCYPRFIISQGLAHNCFWGFVQQENTIFSRELYEKAGGLNTNFRMAGDFDLWRRFAKFKKLDTINISFAAQRQWEGQFQELNFYYKELDKIRCKFNIFYLLRIIYSLILYPLIFFRK